MLFSKVVFNFYFMSFLSSTTWDMIFKFLLHIQQTVHFKLVVLRISLFFSLVNRYYCIFIKTKIKTYFQKNEFFHKLSNIFEIVHVERFRKRQFPFIQIQTNFCSIAFVEPEEKGKWKCWNHLENPLMQSLIL